MLPLRTKLRRHIEERPGASLLLATLLLLPLALWLAYRHATLWEKGTISRTVHRSREELARQSAATKDRIQTQFATLRDYTTLLAADSRIAALLQAPDPASKDAINRYLRNFAATLHLDKAYVLDAQGRCLVANDFAESKSLIGTNFSDREYFVSASQGLPSSQFVVGRVSGVPGFHFSTPVMHQERLLGVVIVKIDLIALAEQLRFSSGFVTDSQGVVVVAEHPDDLLRAVPQAPALAKPAEELKRLYKQERLATLPLQTSFFSGLEVVFYDGQTTPFLRHITALPQEGLTIHAFRPLSDLDTINEQYRLRFYLAALVIAFSMLGLAAITIYFLRDAAQRRSLLLLNAELERQAQHDDLTGCYNRRKFDTVLWQTLRDTLRRQPDFALVLLDLDHFKEVNDRHGHAVGDRMLAHVATVLRQGLRERDALARYGGEEFALILPETDEATAAAIMERLRVRLQDHPLPLEQGTLTQTLSAGVTATREPCPPQQLLEEADMALYAAKARGRNQVVCYSLLPHACPTSPPATGRQPKIA